VRSGELELPPKRSLQPGVAVRQSVRASAG
jgi:hypothetical protein